MGDGPRQSGGRIEQAGTAAAIPAAVLRIADALQHQYLLTYTLPDGVKMSDRITVATSRKGITLTAPRASRTSSRSLGTSAAITIALVRRLSSRRSIAGMP